jgi:hypothetical protein
VPISAFASFGFVVSGFGPVPGSSTIFESRITPAQTLVSLRISRDCKPSPSASSQDSASSVLAQDAGSQLR